MQLDVDTVLCAGVSFPSIGMARWLDSFRKLLGCAATCATAVDIGTLRCVCVFGGGGVPDVSTVTSVLLAVAHAVNMAITKYIFS